MDTKKFDFICTTPGTLHKLINTEKKDAKLIIWSNEVYDKKNHDTYFVNFLIFMKYKILTILGTRPEIIRLSCVIKKLNKYFYHKLVNTNQNLM